MHAASMLDQALTRLDEAARHLALDADVLEKLKYPTVAPQRLKQLLINNAETDIDQPATPSGVIPDSLAPISRIGGGEVRVDRAAQATAGAYGFDLVKTGTRSGGGLLRRPHGRRPKVPRQQHPGQDGRHGVQDLGDAEQGRVLERQR